MGGSTRREPQPGELANASRRVDPAFIRAYGEVYGLALSREEVTALANAMPDLSDRLDDLWDERATLDEDSGGVTQRGRQT